MVLVSVGRVVRPHGVRGEVVVEVRTDEPEQRFAVGSALVVADPGSGTTPATLTVAAQRPHQGRRIVSFQGIADRDAAEALRGVLLQVDSTTLPPPADPDEFHDHQLVGLAAVTPTGDPLGEVIQVDHVPAAELLVVALSEGGTARVPFVRAIVPKVDVAGGRVVVDPPPGLLDL